MKRITLFILVVLMLVGCSYGQTDAVQTVSPTPAVTVMPTPQPTPTPTATPQPTPEVVIEPVVVEPEEDQYFAKYDIEEVTADLENGYWLYRSPTLFVEVNRIFDEEETITYFVADIRVKEDEKERSGYGNPEKQGKVSLQLYDIAQNYKAVIAVNGDFMQNELSLKGIIIRDGIVYNKDNGADTLAFYPDGTLQIFRPDDITADQLLEDGVNNTYSFGPTLINNFEIEPNLDKHRVRSKNPRTAVGMIEPYHYLLVVVDGRSSKYSVGVTLEELAALFAEYDCEVAYNLDGGASSTMSFMGQNISCYKGSLTGQRRVPDTLMFGFSPMLTEYIEDANYNGITKPSS